jgi:hypothetical protein
MLCKDLPLDASEEYILEFMAWKLLSFKQWQNPDYRVRLEYAQRSRNQRKLLHLALNDVHESVRVAAVKNLPSDSDRLMVVERSGCDRSLEIALGMLHSDDALKRAATLSDLKDDLRLNALERVVDHSEDVLLQLASDSSEKIALYAISLSHDSEALEGIYSDDISDARALAIINKSASEGFAVEVFEASPFQDRRLAALRKVSDQNRLKEFYLNEHDSEVRTQVIEQCDLDENLTDFFTDEDDEALRIKIAAKISNEEWLFKTACEDYNINVRRAAAEGIKDSGKLVEVAVKNEDRGIHNVILSKPLDDDELNTLARLSPDSFVRVDAVNRIVDEQMLVALIEKSEAPDVLWFASRRLGKMPILSLRQIQSPEILIQAAKQDSQKIARMAAIRQIKDEWALQHLSNYGDADLARAASALGKEIKTPSGLSFLPVLTRSYQMSVFPVTGLQFARWKEETGDLESAEKYSELDDLPATDVSIEDAKAFCAWLSSCDHARYRLPYFHEWKHAAICDEPNWFSAGRLRAFSSQEEAELVLFGRERSARPLYEGVPNPWGFLDMIGNVMEWTADTPFSEQMLRSAISVDEFAQSELSNEEVPTINDYAYASGNHWADRRIRSGRWKRLIHKSNLNGNASGKVGFRVLRFDSKVSADPVEYELTLLPDVAFGYTVEQVCLSVSQSLSIEYEEAKKHFTVAPYRLAILRDYGAILRIKESWESVGALTHLTSRLVGDKRKSDA